MADWGTDAHPGLVWLVANEGDLAAHNGQWVALTGDGRVAEGSDFQSVYSEVIARSLTPEEVLLHFVQFDVERHGNCQAPEAVTYRVDFDRNDPVSGRPWTALYLIYAAAGVRVAISALVDTGADVTQLPTTAATALGINLAAATPYTVQTAGGPQQTQRLSVEVEVFSKRLWTDVDFSANPLALVGRETILDANALSTFGLSAVDLYQKD